MATYKSTKGFTVQVLADDPTVEDAAGLLYFNTTDNEFKYVIPGGIAVGTWAAGGAMNTARYASGRGTTGTQTAAIASAGNPNRAVVEQYNGSAWTEVADINTARSRAASCATSYTALVIAGGSPPVKGNTESFDGSSWSEVNDLNSARSAFVGAGTQTAGLVFGGDPGAVALTESWNGTS